jgi:hypothetical protein
MIERQSEVQAITEPMMEEMIARMANAGIDKHEIGQALVLTGAGLLTAALGPRGAGHTLRAVSEHTAAWLERIAAAVERETR